MRTTEYNYLKDFDHEEVEKYPRLAANIIENLTDRVMAAERVVETQKAKLSSLALESEARGAAAERLTDERDVLLREKQELGMQAAEALAQIAFKKGETRPLSLKGFGSIFEMVDVAALAHRKEISKPGATEYGAMRDALVAIGVIRGDE